LTVRAHPRASRSEVRVQADGSVEVWTTAPPTDGKANEAITQLVAERISVPVQTIAIIGPAHARTKLIEIEGLSSDEIQERLTSPRLAR
jgi:uncharacterized protein YggU (UPF0235/DUF167 family)